LGDEFNKLAGRPVAIDSNFGVFGEAPKMPRHGKDRKDRWTSSGGKKGATTWPPKREGVPPRVIYKYGKICCVGGTFLRFKEYTLIAAGNPSIGTDKLSRHVFFVEPPPPVAPAAVPPLAPGAAASSREPEATAVRNYEDFHNMPRGTATLDQVTMSSAGVSGWTGYEGRLDR
jgi:hypothetical protein